MNLFESQHSAPPQPLSRSTSVLPPSKIESVPPPSFKHPFPKYIMDAFNVSLPKLTVTKAEFLAWELPPGTMDCVKDLNPEKRWEMSVAYMKSINNSPAIYTLLDMAPGQVPTLGPQFLTRVMERMVEWWANSDDDFAAAYNKEKEIERRVTERLQAAAAATAAAQATVTKAARTATGGGKCLPDEEVIKRWKAKHGRDPTPQELEKRKKKMAKSRADSAKSYAKNGKKSRRSKASEASEGGGSQASQAPSCEIESEEEKDE